MNQWALKVYQEVSPRDWHWSMDGSWELGNRIEAEGLGRPPEIPEHPGI